jgi:hypothetical protein
VFSGWFCFKMAPQFHKKIRPDTRCWFRDEILAAHDVGFHEVQNIWQLMGGNWCLVRCHANLHVNTMVDFMWLNDSVS